MQYVATDARLEENISTHENQKSFQDKKKIWWH